MKADKEIIKEIEQSEESGHGGKPVEDRPTFETKQDIYPTKKQTPKEAAIEVVKDVQALTKAQQQEKKKLIKDKIKELLKEIYDLQNARSPRAKAIDNSRLNQKVISPRNPLVAKWADHPGKYDIIHIDTPKKSKAKLTVKMRKSKGSTEKRLTAK